MLLAKQNARACLTAQAYIFTSSSERDFIGEVRSTALVGLHSVLEGGVFGHIVTFTTSAGVGNMYDAIGQHILRSLRDEKKN